MIKAEVIADSVNPQGNRITSFVVQFPRIVLAELNTHRALSRNSASSRAVPFEKMLKKVQEEPFIPISFPKDHKGMQSSEYHTDPEEIRLRTEIWLNARDAAVKHAKELSNMDVTKQLCNRLLEPFMYHTAIITATELENFFYLRCPQYEVNGKTYRSKKDLIGHNQLNKLDFAKFDTIDWLKINQGKGEIHIMALAEAMWDAYNESTPKELKVGQWHIPFGENIDRTRLAKDMGFVDNSLNKEYIDKQYIKIATARCARVSYINYEGKDDYKADIKLHDMLMKSGHMSPLEHCARVSDMSMVQCSGNFHGFIQYRKMIPNENRV